MAILQQHPIAALLRLLDHLGRLDALTLAQRDAHHAVAHADALSEVIECLRRIGSLRQHEDERGLHIRVLEARLQVERRWLDELGAQASRHVVLDRHHQLVRPETAQHAHLLQNVERVVPLAWQLVLVRVGAVEVLLPCLVVVHEVLSEAREGGDRVEMRDLGPHQGRKPLELRLRLVGSPWRDAGNQELVLHLVHLVTQDLGGQKERVHQLVPLEQRPAHIAVHHVGEELVQDRDALLRLRVLFGVLDGSTEEVRVPAHSVLVHRVDARQVGDTEVQDGRARRNRAVCLARGVDLLLRLCRLRHLHRNFF
mmetsp:Transcript_53888/g.129850  ORF Transcript_53888/g.129850 Transcript_53888/m.129850 type:complete len:311 (+) Transcript_53888:1747-2679(+)